jgi:tRNA modification GTPase
MSETICAISTAPGVGGVAVIRVSGDDAITITDKIFHPYKEGRSLYTQKPYTLQYGTIRKDDETVDDVLAAVFHAPRSFTGENTVEITCHGSIYIQQRILQLLIEAGCRTAKAGEFTQRAFMNGKMDLSQAEAVADLIASTSAGQHKLALNQMRGGFSNELRELREKLLHITSLMELELDFADHEELEFADRTELQELTSKIHAVIEKLAKSFRVGNAIKNGIPVAIIGETNAGKSTLLNALLNEEKAIVSDIHGTTRDVIEDTFNIDGTLFRFIDTAGIRDTADTIESIGIERTFKKIEQASIILWVIDATSAEAQIKDISNKIVPMLDDKQLILVFNKSDLLASEIELSLPEGLKEAKSIFISAKEKSNIKALEELLVRTANIPTLSQNDVIVTNIRHYEALTSALRAIERVQEGLSTNLSGDFVSQDLRECIYHLSDIVGEVTTDQVLGNIFKHFCVGK